MTDTDASARGRSNRNKGAAYERQVAAWLRSHGWPGAERAQRNGWRTAEYVSQDPYDLTGAPGLLWSLKCTHVSEAQMGRYLDEVDSEAERRGLVGLLVAKRHGAADIGSAWCYRRIEVAGVPLTVRTELRDMVDVLHAEGYGDDPIAVAS